MKKFLAILLSAILVMSVLSACKPKEGDSKSSSTSGTSTSDTSEVKKDIDYKNPKAVGKVKMNDFADQQGAIARISKMTGTTMGNMQLECAQEISVFYPGEWKWVDLSPDAAIASKQITAMDEAIAQKCAALVLSMAATAGYDEVIKKAKDANIPLLSYDARATADQRVVHLNSCDEDVFGSYYAAGCILLAIGSAWTYWEKDVDCLEQARAEFKEYLKGGGKEITFGCLSSNVDSPVQNAWIDGIKKEVDRAEYAGKVKYEVKYGGTSDNLPQAIEQANAFVSEGKVQSFCTMSNPQAAAVAPTVGEATNRIPFIACGPSTGYEPFLPAAGTNTIEGVRAATISWGQYWCIRLMGLIVTAMTIEYLLGWYTAKEGEELTIPKSDYYDDMTFKTVKAKDGGMDLMQGAPQLYNGDNAAAFKDILTVHTMTKGKWLTETTSWH